jgi:signal transduction histidine kinase
MAVATEKSGFPTFFSHSRGWFERLRPRTLAGRLNLYLASALVGMMLALSLAGYAFISHTLEQAMEQKAKALASQVATVAKDAVMLQEYSVIDRITSDLLAQTPDLHHIQVVNAQGEILSEVQKQRETGRDPFKTHLHYTAPMAFFGQSLGQVTLGFSRQSIRTTFLQLFGIGLVLFALLLMLVFVIVRRLLDRHLLAPVRDLSERLNDMPALFQQPVPVRQNLPQELQVLNYAIFDLQVALQNHIDSLQEAHQFRQKATQNLCQNQRMVAIGQLAAGLAHNLNTPLANIIGYAQMATQQTRDDAMQKRLQTIEKQAKQCAASVKDLLSAAREPRVVAQAVNLNQLIDGILTMIRPVLKRDAPVEIAFDAEATAWVKGDPSALEQVLYNLISNSAEAGASRVTLSLSPAENHQAWYLWVCDNGKGIEAEKRDQVFEPFFTTKEAGSFRNDNAGTGLGLYLTRTLLEKMQARITLDDSVTEGTQFRIELNAYENTESADY